MNQNRPILLNARCNANRRFAASGLFSGDSCGKPHAKGGMYEEELSAQTQTELPQPIGLDAAVTMICRSGEVRPSASPLNDKLTHSPST